MGIVSTLTLAERRQGALEDAQRRKKVAKKLLTCGVLWDALCKTRYRYRDQLWPLVLLTVLWVSGLAGRGAYPVGVLATSLLGAAIVVFYLRQKLTRRPEWWYAGTCLAAAVGWMVAVSLAPTERWPNVLGVLAWAGLSLIWWRHHEVRGWPGHSRAPLVNLWNENVRDLVGGPLPGAQIDHPVPFEHGNSYTIHLVRGKQNLTKAMAALPLLETALDTPMEFMVLERHPDHPKSPSMLRLQHVTRSPIEHTVWFDRPRYEDGRILLGPYADGMGEAYLRLYEGEQSMWSTTLTGGSGIGKSRLMETIAINALAMRDVGQHTVLFYMDGQNGASSPTLFEHATWAVGPDGAPGMLSALERIADYRNKENRAHQPKPLTGFAPSADRPGILVMIDEAHLILPIGSSRPDLSAKRFANLAKSVRKLGISFFVAAHDYSLNTLLDDTFRAALRGGNALVMNVGSKITGNLIPGLEINPYDLPNIPGYGIVVGATGSGIRTAPFRSRYAPDAAEKARAEARGETTRVPSIEEWFERYPPLGLDKGARRAAGSGYAQRHAVADEDREQLLLEFGEDTDDEPAVDLDAIQPEQPDPTTNGTRTCRDRLLALDWAAYGTLGLQQIFTELPDVTNRAVTKTLQGLVESGELERVARGRYRRKSNP